MAIGQQVGKMHLKLGAKDRTYRAKDRRRRAIATAEDRPRAKMGRPLLHPLFNRFNLVRGVKK